MLPALPPISIPGHDYTRLRAIAERASLRKDPRADFLLLELQRARVLRGAELPPATVVMNGWVTYRLDWGQPKQTRLLVYPQDEITEERVSVLSPLGTALLGLESGARMPFFTLQKEFQLVSVESTDGPLDDDLPPFAA